MATGPEPTPAELEFVERVAQRLAQSGLPRMAGRMWAWLMICEPPEQTAGDVATHLRASRGSISGTARLLETAGLISRITKPGDRREWFRVPPSGMVGMMALQQPVLSAYRQLMDEGLELLRDRPASSRERLRETRQLYAFFEREYPLLLARFQAGETDQDITGTVPMTAT
jgi:DNA-binding transcriptional regulator GbsR (MarR family)